jgi:hypothetical protein
LSSPHVARTMSRETAGQVRYTDGLTRNPSGRGARGGLGDRC